MTKEQWIELADRLDCIEAENLEGGDVLFQASESIRSAFSEDRGVEGLIYTNDLAQAIKKAVEAEREACAKIAYLGCLVPPDGGMPTVAESQMCDGIAKAIRDRKGAA